MRFLFTVFFCLATCSQAVALARDQLYTGDASTVPLGKTQAQAYYDSTFSGPQRVAGGSLTFGAAERMDVRVGYGYLWNNLGPDFKLGPNVGLKWRPIGDGKREPSIAFSCVGAFNSGQGGRSHKNDYGALAIAQYWTKPVIFLLNYGHVWVGDTNSPDLRYLGFALARFLNKHALAALQYTALESENSPRPHAPDQIVAGFVYFASKGLSYSAQLAYLPFGRTVHVHLTLGISAYL